MRYLLPSTALAATLAFAGMAPANASLLAEYSLDGGATFNLICSAASGTACGNASFNAGGLVFTLFGATSNSPGNPTDAHLFQATTEVTNPTGSAVTVQLLVGDTDYALPTAPPQASLINSIAGTVTIGGALNAFSSMACIDQGNGQNVCPGTIDTALINAAITAPGSGSNSNTVLVPLLSAPYSMSELITLTLSPGADINFSASSDLEPVPAPEPASLAIFGSALLGLGGLRAIRRRRKGNQS